LLQSLARATSRPARGSGRRKADGSFQNSATECKRLRPVRRWVPIAPTGLAAFGDARCAAKRVRCQGYSVLGSVADLRVPEQKLRGSEIAGSPINQHRFGSRRWPSASGPLTRNSRACQSFSAGLSRGPSSIRSGLRHRHEPRRHHSRAACCRSLIASTLTNANFRLSIGRIWPLAIISDQ